MVNTVSTTHHNHSLRRCEHIISTNRAIALRGTLNTAVGVLDRDRQANTACLSMIWSQWMNGDLSEILTLQ